MAMAQQMLIPWVDEIQAAGYQERISTSLISNLHLFVLEKGADVAFSLRRYKEGRVGVNINTPPIKNLQMTLQQWIRLDKHAYMINHMVGEGKEGYFHLGNNLHVVFNDTFVNIRYYYYKKEQNMLFPTLRGVTLNHYMWRILYNMMDTIKDLYAPEIKDTRLCLYYHDKKADYISCPVCCPPGWDDQECQILGFPKPPNLLDIE